VLLQGFFRESLPVCGVFVSTGIGDVPAGFGHARTTDTSCVRCTLGGVAMCRAPEPGPVQGDRSDLSDLHLYAPSPSLRRTECEVSTTPINRVADCGFLIELLSGNSSGRPCPVR
jgi:hypothetical protein